MQGTISRRAFVAGAATGAVTATIGLDARALQPAAQGGDQAGVLMVGHVDTKRARIWFRPTSAHHKIEGWRCVATDDAGRSSAVDARLDADHDYTAVADLAGLSAGRGYRVTITPTDAQAPAATMSGRFHTPPAGDRPARVTLALGSCAPSDPNRIWTRVLEEQCQGFVFLGDTPYVDTTDLKAARNKHLAFLSQPEIRGMTRSMPCWGTWDDHDFGRNDGHGDYEGKHTARTAFTEYRANATFGHDEGGRPQPDRFGAGRGIYTRFRYGPIEVFLIDPRWFSRTGPSWADPDQPTCIGETQWHWLKDALKNSDAAFKALTTGMIWDDKRNSEKDDWHTYAHERDAIFDFIRDEKIPGCFLIGGDIHVSRALNYGPRVGYDLWQFIVSPMHDRTIPSLNVPHPALRHSAVEPNVFLKLTADTEAEPATLTAEWVNLDGKRIFDVKLDAGQMRP